VIESRIRDFINDICIPNMKTKTFVADLVIDKDKIILLETNPYGLSDPCLLEYGKMNNQFLYNKTNLNA